MTTYEVSVKDIYDSQSEDHLRKVVAEIRLKLEKDSFFENTRLNSSKKLVSYVNEMFIFRFNIDHKGKPDIGGKKFILNPWIMELSYLDKTRLDNVFSYPRAYIRGDLSYESLLIAIQETAIQEVMDS